MVSLHCNLTDLTHSVESALGMSLREFPVRFKLRKTSGECEQHYCMGGGPELSKTEQGRSHLSTGIPVSASWSAPHMALLLLLCRSHQDGLHSSELQPK